LLRLVEGIITHIVKCLKSNWRLPLIQELLDMRLLPDVALEETWGRGRNITSA